MTKILHLKIIMPNIQPLIWRTFTVADDYRLDRFHQVIQIVMGWQNAHLHEFRIQNRTIGMVLDDFELDPPDMEEESTLFLRDFDLQQGDTFFYLYDFGDGWEHMLQVEKVDPKVDEHPLCTGGENACPPEDCGGIPGYMEMVEVLKNPNHDEYDDYISWLPKVYRPDYFPIALVRKELKKFGQWHRKYPRKKSSPWHQI